MHMKDPEKKEALFDKALYKDILSFAWPIMLANLDEAVTFTASHFDEFIIDDFFFTNCT